MAARIKSRGHTGREKHQFSIQVRLFTDEVFPLKNVTGDMKITELKNAMEFATGIPVHMQRISYLDEGDLLDKSDIRSNDIVPGATLQLGVWPMWKELIEAVSGNDLDWVFSLGVTQPTAYKTPHSDYMTKRARKAWFEERAFLALFIAAHRGHEKLCKRLIDAGADVNASTPLGRTALHIAAAQGHGHIVDSLLERGADIDAEDEDGQTALSIAAKFGHKSCERHLFLFRWQERAKRTHPSEDPDRMAHQFFDSALPVWIKGHQGQMYFTQILPPGEFEGSRMGSPKRPSGSGDRMKPGSAESGETNKDEFEMCDDGLFGDGGRLPVIREERSGQSRRGDGKKQATVSFDAWLNKKKVVEQRRLDIKRKEKEKKKQEEDDRLQEQQLKEQQEQQRASGVTGSEDDWFQQIEKRNEAEKSQSYETWLLQKEVDKKHTEHEQFRDKDREQQRNQGALRTYLRSLGRTRSGPSYEDWYNDKIDALEKQGTTVELY